MRLAEDVLEQIQKAMEGQPLRTTERLSVYAMDAVPVQAFHVVVMAEGHDLGLTEVNAFSPRGFVRGKTCYLVPKDLALRL